MRLIGKIEHFEKLDLVDKILNLYNFNISFKISKQNFLSQKTPKDLVNKQFSVSRIYPNFNSLKEKQDIILTEEETHSIVKSILPSSEISSNENIIDSDINFDGYKEVNASNQFVSFCISPQYGVRISDIFNRYSKKDCLSHSRIFGKKGYVELGGTEDSINGLEETGSIWNSLFNYKIQNDGSIILTKINNKKENIII